MVDVHLYDEPGGDRPVDGEVIMRVDSTPRGRLQNGNLDGGQSDWVMGTTERCERVTGVLDALEALADGRRIKTPREGVFTVAMDAETARVTEVWAWDEWVRDSVSPEDIASTVEGVNALPTGTDE